MKGSFGNEQGALPGLLSSEAGPAVVEGTVKRITFRSEDSGYTVLRLDPDEGASLVTAVGTLPPLHESEHLRLTGRWTRHKRFGRQFQIESCQISPPFSLIGVERYLASGLIKGIGKGLAKLIVDHFGAKTLEVLDTAGERLVEVPTIGAKRARSIQSAWKGHQLIRELMVFLQGVGVTPHLATKIYKEYGDEAMTVLRGNPYRLIRDMRGVGFRTADQVALKVGLAAQAPQRLQAALLHTLDEATREGHVHLPREELLERGRSFIGEDEVELEDALAALVSRRDVIIDDEGGTPCVYLPRYEAAERFVAQRFAELARCEGRLSQEGVDAFVDEVEGRGFGLHEGQVQALRMLVQGRVLLITGGPGTGKTTLLRHVRDLLGKQGLRLALAAPTGRAAKRMEEAIGEKAKTLHRLLAFQPATYSFTHNRENPLPCDALIVDECSMVDLLLMKDMLEALPAEALLVLVGDVDQLPSVGAGWVFHDLIESKVLPCARLTHVFRQAADSQIVRSAHAINRGRLPAMPRKGEEGDFFFIRKNSPEAVAETIVELCARRLPQRFGFDPLGDVQVLCPMHRGVCGTEGLNERLAEALNGESETHRIGPRSFAPGDKVMQTVNDYDKDVFNGDMGLVEGLDGVAGTVTVRFGDRSVLYEESDVDQLQRAFAISVHKSQGSEYPAVVMPITTQHFVMLARNLVYTAVTRARRVVCLVGTERALSLAVQNDGVRRRNGRLVDRLRERVDAAEGAPAGEGVAGRKGEGA